MIPYNLVIINAVRMNTTITSPAMQLKNIYGYSIQAVAAGDTPSGTFKLQSSCDPCALGPPTFALPTNWTDITNSFYTISAAGNFEWNVRDAMYNWVRLIYTDASSGASTSLLTATINCKGV